MPPLDDSVDMRILLSRLYLEGKDLDWQQSFRTLQRGGMGPSTVGVLLLRIFVSMQSPSQLVGRETLARSVMAWYPQLRLTLETCGHPVSSQKRQRDVLPLPVNCHDEDICFAIRWALDPQSIKYSHAARLDWMKRAGAGAWKLVMGLSLNCLFLDRGALTDWGRFAVPLSGPQAQVWVEIEKSVVCFLSAGAGLTVPEKCWKTWLASRSISYTGEEVATPLPLTARQILPSLPPVGVGGSVLADEVLCGRTRDALLNPDQFVLPR